MVLADLDAMARDLATAEDSDAHNKTQITRWINQGMRILVKQTGCNIADAGSVTPAVCQVDGDVSSSTSITVDTDMDRYFHTGDRIDVVAISGTSPNETYTVEASNAKVVSRTKSVVKVASAVTVSDDSHVFFRNDLGLIDTVANESIYYKPWSALEIITVSVKYNSNDRFREIRRSSIKRLQSNQGVRWAELDGEVASGWPSSWMSYGPRQIKVYPATKNAVTQGLKVEYVKDPLPLVFESDLPEIDEAYHPGLAHYAAMMMLMRDRDTQGAAYQREMFESYLGQAAESMDFMPRAAMTRGS